MRIHPDKTAYRAVDACGGTYTSSEVDCGYADGHKDALDAALEAVKKPDALMGEMLAALQCAKGNLDHMAAFLGLLNAGYSFESLGEDMPGINAAIAKATGGAA